MKQAAADPVRRREPGKDVAAQLLQIGVLQQRRQNQGKAALASQPRSPAVQQQKHRCVAESVASCRPQHATPHPRSAAFDKHLVDDSIWSGLAAAFEELQEQPSALGKPAGVPSRRAKCRNIEPAPGDPEELRPAAKHARKLPSRVGPVGQEPQPQEVPSDAQVGPGGQELQEVPTWRAGVALPSVAVATSSCREAQAGWLMSTPKNRRVDQRKWLHHERGLVKRTRRGDVLLRC